MSKMYALATAAAVALAGAAGSAHASLLFGVGNFGGPAPQGLYRIDPTTGQATLVGSTGLRDVVGITYDQANTRLLGLTAEGDLYDINVNTGASVLVGESNQLVPEGDVVALGNDIFTTIFDDLYRWTPGVGVAGTWSLVGASGLSSFDVSALAASNVGIVGIAANNGAPNQVFTFDISTGLASVAVTLPPGPGLDSVGGAVWLSGTSEYLVTDGTTLKSFNLSTGATTSIGAHGIAGMSGIAIIPSPGASALALAAGLLASRRRRTSR